MMTEDLLRIEDLVVQYDTEEGIVQAVDGVNLTVKKGEFLGLVGESGCGKSTLALSIMGLLAKPMGRIVSGHIYLNDVDLVPLKQKEMKSIRGKEISMIFQDPTASLNPVFTVGEQLSEAYKAHDHDIDKNEAKERAIKMLKKVGISNPDTRFSQYPHEYSGGMKQRAMIAIGLANNPQLLIADEPTTIIGAAQFGNMCFSMILRSDAPIERAASTYSVSLNDKTLPRTSLVMEGMPPSPTAIIVLMRPGPSTVTINSAKRILGKAIMISTPRIITASTLPLRKPDTSPSKTPGTRPRTTAIIPTPRDKRPP